MFLLTDCSVTPTKTYQLNDIHDIGDIVLGITNDEDMAKDAMKKAGNMHFGDSCIGKSLYVQGNDPSKAQPLFILDCVTEDEISAQETPQHKFEKGEKGFVIYNDNVYPFTALMVSCLPDEFVFAHFDAPFYGNATVRQTDCFLTEEDARACMNARNQKQIADYKKTITDVNSLLNFALTHVIAGENTDEQAKQAFVEAAVSMGYLSAKKPSADTLADLPDGICATCAKRPKMRGYIGANCLACRHAYFEGSEAYEHKADYYVPEKETDE